MLYEQATSTGRVDNVFIIGTRFYKWMEGEEKPFCIRLIGYIKGTPSTSKKYVFLTDQRKKISIDVESFKQSDFKVLANDGFLLITKYIDDKERDVDVSAMVFKIDDTDKPFVCCRQAITNMYLSHKTPDVMPEKPYLGMSASRETVKELLDQIAAPNGTPERAIGYAVYNDDTLDSIIDMVYTIPYDNALRSIQRRLSPPSREYPFGAQGLTSSLKELFEKTLFMYDFYSTFDISYYNDIKITEYPGKDPLDQTILSDIDERVPVGYRLINVYSTKYDKSIDLSKIRRNYFLAADKAGVWIIAFDIEKIEEK